MADSGEDRSLSFVGWGAAGTEKRLPRPTPHPRGFPLLGFSGLPRWVGKGGVCGEGTSGPGLHPAAPSGGEDKVLPRCLRRGPDRPPPPPPGALCSAVPVPAFLAPPCLKAVKAQSAAGVSV